jgi:hypothetical protein
VSIRFSVKRYYHKTYTIITEVAIALMTKWRHSGLIRKILTHLGLWQIKARPRPIAHGPPDLAAATFDDWPAPSAEDYLTDPLYPFEV